MYFYYFIIKLNYVKFIFLDHIKDIVSINYITSLNAYKLINF